MALHSHTGKHQLFVHTPCWQIELPIGGLCPTHAHALQETVLGRPECTKPIRVNTFTTHTRDIVAGLAPYWADQCGSFQAMPALHGTSRNSRTSNKGRGQALTQRALERPGVNQWAANLKQPLTAIGDWNTSDCTVSADLFILVCVLSAHPLRIVRACTLLCIIRKCVSVLPADMLNMLAGNG